MKPIETASSSQSTEQKIWKTASGERSCSMYKSMNRGVGAARMLGPYDSRAAAAASAVARPLPPAISLRGRRS